MQGLEPDLVIATNREQRDQDSRGSQLQVALGRQQEFDNSECRSEERRVGKECRL